MSWNKWKEAYSDLILVPIGSSYHLFLLYKYLKFPQTTVMGYEDRYKRTWVEKTMQLEAKDKGASIVAINSSNLPICSFSCSQPLIGAWIGSRSEKYILSCGVIYGDTRPTATSIKYIALLSCFLIAFASFIQMIRNCARAAFLISMPNSEIPISYVKKPVIRGSHFWAIGMRALYFAATLILWILGPIPMFVSSVIMVAVLHNLDNNPIPPYQFQPQLRHHHFHKIGEELAAVTRAFGHHERSTVN